MTEKWFEMEAKKELLKPLLEIVHKELAAAGCPAYKLEEIEICVEEIFVNIASYAYLGQEGTVEIGMQMETDKIRMIFKDCGIRYDPTKNENPDITRSADERSIGGLGIYMVKNMTDRLEYKYQNKQNCLLMECSWRS